MTYVNAAIPVSAEVIPSPEENDDVVLRVTCDDTAQVTSGVDVFSEYVHEDAYDALN